MSKKQHQSGREQWEELDPITFQPIAQSPTRRIRARSVTEIEVLHRDDDLLVLNKPAGMPVGMEEDSGRTVLDHCNDSLGLTADKVEFVDHMDANVSGVLIAALSGAARRQLPRAFADGQVTKAYDAIVRASLLAPTGAIDVEIGPDRNGPARMRIGGSHARPAHTEWTLRDQFVAFALLECRTTHERMDQVRLHLQAIGMPLAVDPTYGGRHSLMLSSFKPSYKASRRHEELPLIARVSLHVARLELPHPATDERMTFCAPQPRDFRAALRQLDKYGRVPAVRGRNSP